MWASYKLFGSSALALKLPNILSFPIYIYFVYKISFLLKNRYLHWGFFICMLLAHNFFEFFGTGRGYGMSMAFLAGGIWFTMLAIQDLKTRNFVWAFVFLALASFANLTIMNSFIILTGILVLSIFLKSEQKSINKIKNLSAVLILGIAPILLLIKLLFALQAKGELYYGEPEGFFQVSIKSLTKLLSGLENEIFPYTALLFFVAMTGIYIYLFFQKKGFQSRINRLKDPQWIFFFLLIGNIVAYYLEQKLFGTDFPEDRTGLFLYPFFIGTVFFGLDQIRFKKTWYSIIPIIPFLFFPIHFIYNMNTSWSSLENHAIPETFYSKVMEGRNTDSYPPTIEGYHTRTMRWNYLNFRNNQELASISFDSYPSLDGDYQIVWPDENPRWLNYYDSIDSDPNSRLQLLKRKNPLKKELVLSVSSIVSEANISNEYFELYRGSADSLRGNSVYVGFKLNLLANENPFHAWLVTSITDKNNNNLRYEYIPLYWYRDEWINTDKPFINGMLINSIPDEATSIVSYIWNIGGKPFTVKQSELEIFKLKRDY